MINATFSIIVWPTFSFLSHSQKCEDMKKKSLRLMVLWKRFARLHQAVNLFLGDTQFIFFYLFFLLFTLYTIPGFSNSHSQSSKQSIRFLKISLTSRFFLGKLDPRSFLKMVDETPDWCVYYSIHSSKLFNIAVKSVTLKILWSMCNFYLVSEFISNIHRNWK